MGLPIFQGDHHGVPAVGGLHLQGEGRAILRGPEHEIGTLTRILEDPAGREGRQPRDILDVPAHAGEASVRTALPCRFHSLPVTEKVCRTPRRRLFEKPVDGVLCESPAAPDTLSFEFSAIYIVDNRSRTDAQDVSDLSQR